MAVHTAEVELSVGIQSSFTAGGVWNATVNQTVGIRHLSEPGNAPYSSVLLSIGITSNIVGEVYSGLSSNAAPGVVVFGRGALHKTTQIVQIYLPPVGTLNNIEDLPGSAADGTSYNILGLAANREPVTAIYSTYDNQWHYQPYTSGSASELNIINPLVGKNITMPDYINVSGVPHVPKLWSVSTLGGTYNHSFETIESGATQAVSAGSTTRWRWKVSDLADPGTGKYSLNTWPSSSGGPNWYSSGFYRPQVKGTVKFNLKKNKTRAQRSVVFNQKQVDHMWMEYAAGLPQPFTVVVAGIIHSYPSAKFGHYILDAGKATPVFDADRTGKDFFFNEGASPRNVMLYMKKTARMATNTQPDMKDGLNIRIKHTEKARPRVFYGVFNGANSAFGARDSKSKFHGTGPLDGGTHRYFVMGRRTNRVSDNRAAVMSIWDINIFHRALTKAEIDGVYEELANTYQFKEYQ